MRRSSRYSCARTRAAVTAGGAVCLLVLQQPFEHADRGVERGAHGASLCLAVPAAVFELLAEEPVHQPSARFAEVRAERQRAAVDARLDLALEEGRVAELRPPGDLVANEAHGFARALAPGIDPHLPQEQQGVQCRCPLRVGYAVTPLPVRPLA